MAVVVNRVVSLSTLHAPGITKLSSIHMLFETIDLQDYVKSLPPCPLFPPPIILTPINLTSKRRFKRQAG